MEPLPGCSSDPDFPSPTNDNEKSKTRDILQQYIRDSQDVNAESATGYVYRDADTPCRELSELYSYGEEKDYTLNIRAFEDLLINFNLPPSWRLLSSDQKTNTIMRLLDQLEINNVEVRTQAARCILYIAQGCWADLHSAAEQTECVRDHVMLLYRLGTFSALVDLLKMEIEKFHYYKQITQKDSETLRVILAVLYTITEIIRSERDCANSLYKNEVEAFCSDLLIPINDELLIVTLFDVMVRFSDCHTNSSYFPIKKLLLLLWKLILASLGGLDELEEAKRAKRKKNGLPPQHDPDEGEQYDANVHLQLLNLRLEDFLDDSTKRTNVKVKRRPKVHPVEYDQFLDDVRVKFIGYSLLNDRTTTAGLPHSIRAGIDVIKKHLYVPLGQVQIDKEKMVRSHPFTNPDVIESTPTETLYQAMFPNFKKYMLGLIKILLMVVPNKQKKAFTCRPVIAGLARDDEKSSVIYPIVLNIDMFRHEEIILKAISAVILLLLKHLKLNNVYQFEYMCQCLAFNNIVPIMTTFFNQNISAYVKTLNEIPALDFPSCVIGYQAEITVESLNLTKSDSFSPRNMFLCINLLRILNKIAKWKPARITQLVLIDSKTILWRLIRVNHEMLKVYTLKLLKMQMKYLGKTWRKSNITVLTEIYLKVRLHLNDNFLSHLSVETHKKKWKTKQEVRLRNDINEFNTRRYGDLESMNEVPVDNCIRGITGRNWELPQCLRLSLLQWLHQEILS